MDSLSSYSKQTVQRQSQAERSMPSEIYRSRFYDSMPKPVQIEELILGIRKIDDNFTFDGTELIYDQLPYGKIEITRIGTTSFNDYANQLRANADEIFKLYGYKHPIAMQALDAATTIIVLHALCPADTRGQNQMFEIFDPIWDWLISERNGILNVDGGLFQDRNGIIC